MSNVTYLPPLPPKPIDYELLLDERDNYRTAFRNEVAAHEVTKDKLSYWRHAFGVVTIANITWALYLAGWIKL